MKINRVWSMPNKNTFRIKPIKELIDRYLKHADIDLRNIVDPFANNAWVGHKLEKYIITNDIDTQYNTSENMDALDFLKSCVENSVDILFYDPPYSPRQVSECYKKLDMTVNMQTTQSSYWGNQKKEISRIISKGGYVITCGWNSGGIGKTNGFEIVEILLVPHGGWHNDTIVTVERKL